MSTTFPANYYVAWEDAAGVAAGWDEQYRDLPGAVDHAEDCQRVVDAMGNRLGVRYLVRWRETGAVVYRAGVRKGAA